VARAALSINPFERSRWRLRRMRSGYVKSWLFSPCLCGSALTGKEMNSARHGFCRARTDGNRVHYYRLDVRTGTAISRERPSVDRERFTDVQFVILPAECAPMERRARRWPRSSFRISITGLDRCALRDPHEAEKRHFPKLGIWQVFVRDVSDSLRNPHVYPAWRWDPKADGWALYARRAEGRFIAGEYQTTEVDLGSIERVAPVPGWGPRLVGVIPAHEAGTAQKRPAVRGSIQELQSRNRAARFRYNSRQRRDETASKRRVPLKGLRWGAHQRGTSRSVSCQRGVFVSPVSEWRV
jgi:hypothetical protein